MAAKRERAELVDRVQRGAGKTTSEVRRAAFDNRGVGEPAMAALVDKVARTAWKVTDEDVAAARAHATDDEVYEQVVAAAVGQATRQLDAASAALDAACAGPERTA